MPNTVLARSHLRVLKMYARRSILFSVKRDPLYSRIKMFFLYLLVTQSKVSAYTFYIQKTHFSRQRREDAFLEM